MLTATPAAPLHALVDLILPARCPACRTIVDGDGRFCAGCWAQLAFITAPHCACCGAPFDHDRGAGALCGACLAAAPRYTTARAAVVYGGPARSVVLAMKHGDRAYLAGLMAAAMARVGELPAGALLVPVPLHRWRLWRRGFNQAAAMAQALARLTGLETEMMALQRVKATPPSQGLGRAARAANVRGAFRVVNRERIRGRDVVLVDDVLTTGATADACARHLKRAGARAVHVLTYARVVRDA